jgi:hypothetical protein
MHYDDRGVEQVSLTRDRAHETALIPTTISYRKRLSKSHSFPKKRLDENTLNIGGNVAAVIGTNMKLQ